VLPARHWDLLCARVIVVVHPLTAAAVAARHEQWGWIQVRSDREIWRQWLLHLWAPWLAGSVESRVVSRPKAAARLNLEGSGLQGVRAWGERSAASSNNQSIARNSVTASKVCSLKLARGPTLRLSTRRRVARHRAAEARPTKTGHAGEGRSRRRTARISRTCRRTASRRCAPADGRGIERE
jgi:hypothetical protein